MNPTLSVVIPVYNEERTILRVLEKLASLDFVHEIIVVDDGSRDATRQLLRSYRAPTHPPVTVILQPENRGKGAAVRAGFERASGELVVIQDADLELDPAEIKHLYDLVASGASDVAFGSRFLRASPRIGLSFIANKILTLMTALLVNQRITDMETCYKLFRRDALRRLHLRSNRFGIEPELTIKTARRGFRIRERPIRYVPRREGKKINWKDGFVAIWHIIVFRWWDRP